MELTRTLDTLVTRNDANRYGRIREHARNTVVADWPKVCKVCGYSKHVEAAHIKEIKFFPMTSTLGEVNHPSNLVLLCPNCHWEFDHGKLEHIIPRRHNAAVNQ